MCLKNLKDFIKILEEIYLLKNFRRLYKKFRRNICA
uniref:Uncharacterized protein n=1 Tax=viral metagenome TaxID=1070528 RepID=A0A6C0AEX8_9ZZZZ